MGRDDTLYLSCSRSSFFILSPNDTLVGCLATRSFVRSFVDRPVSKFIFHSGFLTSFCQVLRLFYRIYFINDLSKAFGESTFYETMESDHR